MLEGLKVNYKYPKERTRAFPLASRASIAMLVAGACLKAKEGLRRKCAPTQRTRPKTLCVSFTRVS